MRVFSACLTRVALLTALAASLASLNGQQPAPKPLLYGTPVTLEKAKIAAAAAAAEAGKNGWLMAVAIVDPSGDLVYFERADSTQTASLQLSIDKARSAALFKRSTKIFEDQVVAGGAGLRQLKNPDVIPIEGGIPLVEDGKVVGAIGVSGGASAQDGQCAIAGAAVIHY
jgi:uncharacterized protein GlcG (DUF336 family)